MRWSIMPGYLQKVMMEKGDGAIINTASVAGVRAGAGTNAYSFWWQRWYNV